MTREEKEKKVKKRRGNKQTFERRESSVQD